MKALYALLLGSLVIGAGLAVAGWRSTQTPSPPLPPQAMFYSGVLVKDGVGVEGTHPVSLRFFDQAKDGNPLSPCPTDGVMAEFTQGRFRVAVNTTCVSTLIANPTAFVEVVVSGLPGGDLTIPASGSPRPQIGSVPFALNSATAGSASFAATATTASAAEPGQQLDRILNPHLCGVASATNGALAVKNGYLAATTLCRGVSTCSATTATLCTATDAVRALAAKGTSALPSSAATEAVVSTGSFTSVSSATSNDCGGFTQTLTSAGGATVATAVEFTGGSFTDVNCAGEISLLCCDY